MDVISCLLEFFLKLSNLAVRTLVLLHGNPKVLLGCLLGLGLAP